MGFCRVQPYGSIGLLVSFFISKMSYRYNFLSSECLTINDAWNALYLSISPTSSYTGNANRESYRYQPNFAFLQCFSSLFSRKYFPTAISISSWIPCAALAFAFAFVPFMLCVYFEIRLPNAYCIASLLVSKVATSTWHDTSWLMSVLGNLSGLM